MRSAVAAFALLRRAGSAGRVEYLARWNDRSNAFACRRWMVRLDGVLDYLDRSERVSGAK